MIPIRYNVRSLLVRKPTTIATALGIALVVFVLATSLMLSAGIKKTLGTTGRDDVAIVLRKGSYNELGSVVEDAKVGILLAMPGVKHTDAGAVSVREVIVVAAMDKIGASGTANVQIRGTSDDAMSFRPGVRIVAGRAARPGTDEAVIGQRIRGRFLGTDLDQSFELQKGRTVKIVGVFEDGGSSHESEIWVGIDVLRTAYRRLGIVSSVRVQLDSPRSFEAFQAAVRQDKRLGLDALREPSYYEKISEGASGFVGGMGTLVAVFFSIGAMIGAAITMYGAAANRQREIGTLRALGFSRGAVLLSFIMESVLIAAAGGVVGLAASFSMRAVRFSVMNYASWSEIVFSFEPTAATLGTALGFAGVMGLVGGIFPAIRASRISPVVAMRGG